MPFTDDEEDELVKDSASHDEQEDYYRPNLFHFIPVMIIIILFILAFLALLNEA